jgi:hypothetical protein
MGKTVETLSEGQFTQVAHDDYLRVSTRFP